MTTREELIAMAQDLLRTNCTSDDVENYTDAERLAVAVLDYLVPPREARNVDELCAAEAQPFESRYARNDRRARVRRMIDDGYRAALAGKPCNAPTTRELDRAAWEQGWRAGWEKRS